MSMQILLIIKILIMKRNLKFRPVCSLATFGDNGCKESTVSTISVSDCAEEVVVIEKDASGLSLTPFKEMQVDACLKRGDDLETVAADILQPSIN